MCSAPCGIRHLGGEYGELRGREAHAFNSPHGLRDRSSFDQLGRPAVRLSEARNLSEGLASFSEAASQDTQ